MIGRHSRPAFYRHRHETPLVESALDWIATLSPGWCYAGIYVLGAAAGILFGIIITMFK